MTTQRLRITNRSGASASRVRILFAPSRSFVLRAEVSQVPANNRVLNFSASEDGVDATFASPIGAGADFELTVEVRGAPILLASIDFGEGAPPLGAALAALIEKRVHRVEAIGDPNLRRYQKFFFDLDCETSGRLLRHFRRVRPAECDRRILTINAVSASLTQRLLSRGRFVRDEAVAVPGDDDPVAAMTYDPASSSQIQYVSDLLLGTVYRHFGDVTNPTIRDDVWTAFEMFAGGELACATDPCQGEILPWNCEPDSANYFLFAEVGLLAIEPAVGIDLDEWMALLPCLVGTQPIYVAAYAPPGGPAAAEFFDYGVVHRRVGSLSPEAKAELRRVHARMSLPELVESAARHVRAAFPANF